MNKTPESWVTALDIKDCRESISEPDENLVNSLTLFGYNFSSSGLDHQTFHRTPADRERTNFSGHTVRLQWKYFWIPAQTQNLSGKQCKYWITWAKIMKAWTHDLQRNEIAGSPAKKILFMTPVEKFIPIYKCY